MQGTGNLTRTYKQKNKDVRYDKKRDKHSAKELARKERRLKAKEIDDV